MSINTHQNWWKIASLFLKTNEKKLKYLLKLINNCKQDIGIWKKKKPNNLTWPKKNGLEKNDKEGNW